MTREEFVPYLRFMVCSDVHFRDEEGKEQERMTRAIRLAYKIAEADTNMPCLDAMYVVGDFADSGSEVQMRRFKRMLDEEIRPETQAVLSVASHETNWCRETPQICWDRFESIFGYQPDTHRVIKGFHFIMVSPYIGCGFGEDKINYAERELKLARKDAPQKPIFFFQHPHLTDTVYGGIRWAEKDLIPTLCNYPQVIDFSGHSHCPVNDPRSVHQQHFTSFGTGSMSYFELDEMDKYTGTCPKGVETCAQMLIVEVSKEGAVLVRPYDVITESFFPVEHFVPTPWDVNSFTYTRDVYPSFQRPWFEKPELQVTGVKADGFTVSFPQATSDYGFCDDYCVTVTEADTGLTVAKKLFFSEYYIKEQPPVMSVAFEGLAPGKTYRVEVQPGNFRRMYGKAITCTVKL